MERIISHLRKEIKRNDIERNESDFFDLIVFRHRVGDHFHLRFHQNF